jgi:tRNA pseudouridine13 synthase
MSLGEDENPQGRFTTFVLQKQDWNTIQALVAIAKKLGHGKKSIGYAGTKDRTSVSVQLASIFGAAPDQLLGLMLKDISINGAWKSNGVEMGSNIGNAFDVTVENVARPDDAKRSIEELDGKVPNYFDRQRFGSRLNNAKIGLAIMKGDFEGAVMMLLTDVTEETNDSAIEARRRLFEEKDFGEALTYFPRYLRNEFYVMAYLSEHSGDYAGALRRLPRGVSLMFVHAVQSLIFNLEVEERIRQGNFESNAYCGRNFYGFPDSESVTEERSDFAIAPLIGYETNDKYISEEEMLTMGEIGITKDSFNIKSMPELSMRGAFRPLLAPFKELRVDAGDGNMRLSFSIPSGSYATVLINEITKAEDLDFKQLYTVSNLPD